MIQNYVFQMRTHMDVVNLLLDRWFFELFSLEGDPFLFEKQKFYTTVLETAKPNVNN